MLKGENIMINKSMGDGNNISKNSGSSQPRTPSGNGSTNKQMTDPTKGVGTNIGTPGGSLNQKNK